MQQHSYPSHSKHFVFPAAPVSGFTIEAMVDAAAEPGPLRFTRVFVDEVHILREDSLRDESASVGVRKRKGYWKFRDGRRRGGVLPVWDDLSLVVRYLN